MASYQYYNQFSNESNYEENYHNYDSYGQNKPHTKPNCYNQSYESENPGYNSVYRPQTAKPHHAQYGPANANGGANHAWQQAQSGPNRILAGGKPGQAWCGSANANGGANHAMSSPSRIPMIKPQQAWCGPANAYGGPNNAWEQAPSGYVESGYVKRNGWNGEAYGRNSTYHCGPTMRRHKRYENESECESGSDSDNDRDHGC